MNYSEALEFLFNSIPNYQKSGQNALRPGLTNILTLTKHFKNPHKTFESIHVGGTNGKGSVSTSIANFCLSLNLKVGLFTSPHVYDFRERIQVNGKKIDKKFIQNFIKNNHSFFRKNDFSFFEINTIMAFEYFKNQKVDLAIIEVGLGGRLDSTNIIDPLISVITNVGYDHQNVLGKKIEDIATEKSGIIKKNTLFIKGEKQNTIDKIFIDECKNKNVQYIDASSELNIETISKNLSERDIRFIYNKSIFEIYLDNPTNYYFKNTITALVTFLRICKIYNEKPLFLNNNKYTFSLYGRWNVISKNPYIISDGCHNIDGFQSIIKEINSLSYNKVYFIIGGVREKSWSKICNILPKKYRYIITQSSNKRSISTSELSKYFNKNNLKYQAINNINQAIKYCKKLALKDDLIFIGGTLFLISDHNEK
tara:strand:+ start:5354 stop:6625 length:1272 start_codon:yes stop_codon:yes gene_type:complete